MIHNFHGCFLVVLIIRIVKAGKVSEQTTYVNQPIIKEKEIIREIVKIRCPYCGELYDEKLDKCPNCGGKKP
jgi:tRNA(Ile2) C34 agmatinyltransferase TiaS